MEEWKKYKLEEIGTIVTGKTPSTKNPDNYGGDVHFITPGDLSTGNKHVIYTNRNITSSGLSSIKGSMLPKGAICVSCIGNLGYAGIATMQCASNQQINSIIVNPNHNPEFIYYVIKHMWPVFKCFEGQSTALSILNKSQFSKIEVALPNKKTQDRIASILSSFDDKIELNNRINHNLEEQAQALYKSWFVDFEPFKGGKFVESELGMIPNGWRVAFLGELTHTITKGTTPSSLGHSFESRGIPFLKVESISENHTIDYSKIAFISQETNEVLSRSIISSGDIVFSIAGSLGRFALIDDSSPKIMNTNQAVAIIRANQLKVSSLYLYSLFLGGWHQEYCQKNIQQAVQANLSLSTLRNMPIIIPDETSLNKYMAVVSALIETINHNNANSLVLSKLRDNLLPQLLSGEITC